MHPLSSPSYEMGSNAMSVEALWDDVHCHHQDSASGDHGDLVHNSSVVQFIPYISFLLVFWAVTGNNQSCILRPQCYPINFFLHTVSVCGCWCDSVFMVLGQSYCTSLPELGHVTSAARSTLARRVGGQQTERVVFCFIFYVNSTMRISAVQILLPNRTQFLQQTSRFLKKSHTAAP